MRKIHAIIFLFLIARNLLFGQCTVMIDVANLQHVHCPNGGAVGSASIQQSNFTNYWWNNITTGQQNSNFGPGVTSVNNLDAGLYVITATDPFNSSCPPLVYSDTFEILEAQPDFQFNPNQACPSFCNVLVTTSMQIAIPGVSYDYQFDSNPIVSLPNTLINQCGGLHTYEIFANSIGCGIENIGISQFAQMNLTTSVTNATCTQQSSATVSITGVGASAISTYCTSTPTYNLYTTIDNILMVGDNTTISNNTSSICDTYQDYTAQSADVTPGSSYNLTIDLGSCNTSGEYLIDIANVYIDWNIDGDFNDLNELVGQVSPTQSPSTHNFTIVVPSAAIPGESRMRIVAQNNQWQVTNQALACDYNSAYFGSTEDYTILIGGSVATPVSYLWSDGQTTATANNLDSGIYTVIITDANGCSATDTAIVTGLLFGCTNPLATNYDSNAICDDGSCILEPTIDTVFISQPILSYCQTGGMQVNINQTLPLTTYSCVAGYYIGSFFISWIITNQTTGNQLNMSGFDPNIDYFVRIVDSTTYYNSNGGSPNGYSTTGVYDEFGPINFSEPAALTVIASGSQIICNGGTPNSLTASSGVAGTYSWSPSSNFIDANIQNPIFNSGLTSTTTYTITFTDSLGCIATDSVLIIVNPVPTVILTANPNFACVGDDIMLTAIPSASSVYRFQYKPSVSSIWTDFTSPVWSSVNPQTYPNIGITTDFRVKVREASGCIASPWSSIITVPVNTIGTPLISHN